MIAKNHILSLDTYNIVIGNLKDALSLFLNEKMFSSYFILVDENTEKNCLPYLLEILEKKSNKHIIHIKSGEIHKNIDTCSFIWQKMLEQNADRNALFINLGGGVIGDMGGFSAAAYKRGIAFIQIPTTLLSQVDASIGGKLGIDFMNIKNVVGFFQNPQAVFIYPPFLKTLPQRQVLNGFAEIIKHALIADAEYWEQLKNIGKINIHTVWEKIILQSLHIKKRIVEIDPYEKGLRKVLNFGHTIGHAVESYSLEHDENPLLHGEAIIIGMIAELYLSQKNLHFPDQKLKEIITFLQSLYPKYHLPLQKVDEILAYLKNDKKNIGNQINFTLLTDIGKSEYNQKANKTAIVEALHFYQNL
ncbi:MAG: 3-dehydroquinate synthase [Chitinophagales bacterium]